MKAYFSQYKFQGDYLLRKVFAVELADVITKYYKGYIPVPVPVSSGCFRERQFNQVSAILEAANVSYLSLFEKLDNTHQSSRTKKERLLVEKSYRLLKVSNIPDKILIVDDIYTTGSTIIALRKQLAKVANSDIKSLSIAR